MNRHPGIGLWALSLLAWPSGAFAAQEFAFFHESATQLRESL
jgi:hypothetical protein